MLSIELHFSVIECEHCTWLIPKRNETLQVATGSILLLLLKFRKRNTCQVPGSDLGLSAVPATSVLSTDSKSKIAVHSSPLHQNHSPSQPCPPPGCKWWSLHNFSIRQSTKSRTRDSRVCAGGAQSKRCPEMMPSAQIFLSQMMHSAGSGNAHTAYRRIVSLGIGATVQGKETASKEMPSLVNTP